MNILISLNGDANINISKLISDKKIDYIIGVDGGYNHLQRSGIKADLLIGDLDSVTSIDIENVIALNPIKDETDFLEALNYVKVKFNTYHVFVIGFLSNIRPEHFYNNLKYLDESITFISQYTMINYLTPGVHDIEVKPYKYLSLFTIYDNTLMNIKNAKYELNNELISIKDSYTISNEVLAENCAINVIIDKPCLVFKSV